MELIYDIVVVGAGHAGCEAAMAAARMGCRTLLITQDMTKFANMSCNPAVGGVAKGQIVREIDALGGEMGRITDLSTIQFRMLNRSKGAAMWSPRAQCDKARFSAEWRRALELQECLYLWQDSVVEVLFDAERTMRGVRTAMGVEFTASAVVLTSGTFMGGLMHCGAAQAKGGRAGDQSSEGVSESLAAVGFEVGRMKTGTPARLDARTIDFAKLEEQAGDEQPSKFSYSTSTHAVSDQLPCYLVYTSKDVHDMLRTGFDQSPLFNGTIKGIGPRYCPSIEDKLRTFADKDQHQLFLEPEGRDTTEYYLNGFSSSLPWQVQMEALRGIEGFESVHIFRPGYAIEYDYFPPTQLRATLETKLVDNLYFAGQINGTTGYEEAAAQGLMAGLNAALKVQGRDQLVLARDEAYIGVLIDDLVSKGVDEPYRMFTSRAEHRILLRQDNADLRLTPIGRRVGLVGDVQWGEFEAKRGAVEELMELLSNTSIKASAASDYLVSIGQEPITQGRKASELLARNGVTIDGLAGCHSAIERFVKRDDATVEVLEQCEIQVKYRGYIERERSIAEKLVRLDSIAIPEGFDYMSFQALTIEARQKLTRVAPRTIGQASRVPGVSPSDINVLLVRFGR
ncbi:MAG: tRNA uridine-5-carboxymethylaminomethyl(34) synthesis enzyme MnmG [Rikenellaceae bacterium]